MELGSLLGGDPWTMWDGPAQVADRVALVLSRFNEQRCPDVAWFPRFLLVGGGTFEEQQVGFVSPFAASICVHVFSEGLVSHTFGFESCCGGTHMVGSRFNRSTTPGRRRGDHALNLAGCFVWFL